MTKNQNGFILPTVIICITFFAILVIGLLPIVTNEVTATHRLYTSSIAQFTAEAGAKLAIRHVRSVIDAGILSESIKGTITGSLSTLANSPTYTVTYQPNNSLEEIHIRSTSLINGIRGTSNVNVLVINKIPIPNPGVVGLIESSNDYYPSDKPWSISGKYPNQIARPPLATGYSDSWKRIMFNDHLDSNAIHIDYNITLDKIPFLLSSTNAGYGIYYYATGSSNHINSAYTFQYDPGAFLINSNNTSDGGAFFVKKLINNIETRDYRYGFQDNGVDEFGQDRGTVRVSLNDLVTIMNTYYTEQRSLGNVLPDGNPYPESFSIMEQRHSIKIDTITDTTPTLIKYRNTSEEIRISYKYLSHHVITCDGKEILRFTDYDGEYLIPHTSTDTKSGVRVWNANVTFNNNRCNNSGQTIYKDLIWVK
jgi:hypothetical protein